MNGGVYIEGTALSDYAVTQAFGDLADVAIPSVVDGGCVQITDSGASPNWKAALFKPYVYRGNRPMRGARP